VRCLLRGLTLHGWAARCDLNNRQVSILSHGNGLHVFNPDMAARVAEDVIKDYASEDGKLRAEGCCEFFKQEKMFQAMTREEKEAWYQENPDFDYTKKVVLGSPEPAQE
jgi:hypothetical protein